MVNGKRTATYWKNGIETKLFNGRSDAIVIAVKGTDTYIAGYVDDPNATVYWKNGQLVKLLASGGSTAIGPPRSIWVDRNDIYILGERNQYWKNGAIADIPNFPLNVRRLAVKNGMMYMTGSASSGYWYSFANGTTTILLNAYYLTNIAMHGADFYVAGAEMQGNDGHAVYWKNGIKQTLNVTTKTTKSSASGIAVNDNGAHVVGQVVEGDNYSAAYWFNGVATNLGSLGHASDIILNGNETHIVGQLNGHAYYWKNGNPVILNSEAGLSHANGIALVPR